MSYYKVPLRDVVGLKSRGGSQIEQGEHRRSIFRVYERCVVHGCCTAAVYTARMFMEFRGSAGWTCPSCVTMARPHNTHTRTHRSTVRTCYETSTLKYGYCYTVAVTSKAYCAIPRHTAAASSRPHSKNEKEQGKLNGTCS